MKRFYSFLILVLAISCFYPKASLAVYDKHDILGDSDYDFAALTLDEHDNAHLCVMGYAAKMQYWTDRSGSWVSEDIASSIGYALYSQCSIVIKDGEPVISFYKDTGNVFRVYERDAGTWTEVWFDSGRQSGSGASNPYGANDLAIDGSDTLHLCYGAYENSGAPMYYYGNNATLGAWLTQEFLELDKVAECSLAVKPGDGSLHLFLNDYSTLYYMTNESGSWGTHIPIGSTDGFTTDAVFHDGKVHLAFNSSAGGGLYYGQRDAAGNWNINKIKNSTSGTGHDVSIVVGAYGRVHLAYVDGSDLKYTYKNSDENRWSDSHVLDSIDMAYYRSVSMDVASNGKLYLVYKDSYQKLSQLRYDGDRDGDGYDIYTGGDCNDNDAGVYPGATEYCGKDHDCDGVDNDQDSVDANRFFPDADGDGYGEFGAEAQTACADTYSGYVTDHTDCDDSDPTVHPGATEHCGKDHDCDGIDNDQESIDANSFYPDNDADGYGDSTATAIKACADVYPGYVMNNEDCSDVLDYVHPGAEERCGYDYDCDGIENDRESVDANLFYKDLDGDGYGDASDRVPETSCAGSYPGYSLDKTDCDDSNASVNPGGVEVCDGLDNDCSGGADNGVGSIFYLDADGDGYGTDSDTVTACKGSLGYVLQGGDCDDSQSAINPAGTEVCSDGIDQNCDGSDFACPEVDNDGDGHLASAGDCNDADATVFPGATEICDGVDNNCNGNIDEAVTTTFYLDADGDGYGTDLVTQDACVSPAGYVLVGGDCDDANLSLSPESSEICGDGIDQNCDGSDVACPSIDNDGDGYLASSGDCDDTDATVYPGASEVCDGLDNNCDGSIDELATKTFYLDSDGDGFGDATQSMTACSAAEGYVSLGTDCNDSDASIAPGAADACGDGIDQNCDGTDPVCSASDRDGDGVGKRFGDCNDFNANVYPGAAEVCDGLDNNCDGTVDELVKTNFYLDADGDGYGDTATFVQACSRPTGYVDAKGDCDDSNPAVFPGGDEICGNGLDENCDGGDLTCVSIDADGDGHTIEDGDCDDMNKKIHPDASEQCNGRDDNCNGVVDEDVQLTFYQDTDGDGYGNADITQESCAAPSGYVVSNRDCDDSQALISPSGTEVCGDGIDQNCDGGDLACSPVDSDGDGYTIEGGDCDDSNASVHPAASEICDGADNNCDGVIDESVTTDFYRDLDGDGYGTAALTVSACSQPAGFVNLAGDCDDSRADIMPEATELCGDGIDQNCDGSDIACEPPEFDDGDPSTDDPIDDPVEPPLSAHDAGDDTENGVGEDTVDASGELGEDSSMVDTSGVGSANSDGSEGDISGSTSTNSAASAPGCSLTTDTRTAQEVPIMPWVLGLLMTGFLMSMRQRAEKCYQRVRCNEKSHGCGNRR